MSGSRPIGPGEEPEPLPPEKWDLSGDEPPRSGPAPRVLPVGRLDPSKDPDRYDPVRDALATPGRLDPAKDPDRYRPGTGETLPELLGDGAQEDQRDNLAWAVGLLAMIAFLLLVAFLFGGFGR